MSPRRVPMLIAMAAVLALGACGSDDTEPEPDDQGANGAESDSDEAEPGPGDEADPDPDPDSDSDPDSDESDQRYPDIADVEVEESDGTYSFDVTVSSPYDTPERYADGWRIKVEDGTVHGEHELMHDHANEQPFTRTQSGVQIPPDVEEVIVEGRDLEHGYGGGTETVELP